MDDLTPLEQAIWAAAYARTVYPVQPAFGNTAVQPDKVVESAERYADTIVRQYRESRDRRVSVAAAAAHRPEATPVRGASPVVADDAGGSRTDLRRVGRSLRSIAKRFPYAAPELHGCMWASVAALADQLDPPVAGDDEEGIPF